MILSNDFLAAAADSLRQGNTVKLLIGGDSMYPFIRGGVDTVEVEPCPPTGDLPRLCCPFYCWQGHYMIHRYIGIDPQGNCRMLGDGNIYRIETVPRSEIIGLLRTIHHPDGTTQDTRDPRWQRLSSLWYHLRPVRRILLPLLKRIRK